MFYLEASVRLLESRLYKSFPEAIVEQKSMEKHTSFTFPQMPSFSALDLMVDLLCLYSRDEPSSHE